MNLETCTPAQASLSPAIASITTVFHNWPLLELFLISGVEVRWGEEMQGWCVRQLEQNGLSLAVSSAQPEPIAAERGQGAETLDVKSRKRREGSRWSLLMCLPCWLLLSLHFSTSQLALSLGSIPQHKECLLLMGDYGEKGTGV